MTMSSHPRRRGEESIFKKTPPRLGHLWLPLLVHIPDLGQQGRQLLVLESQCKDLLRVHGAEGAQAHQLHEHAWEAELVLWALDPRVGEERLHVGLLQGLHTAGLLHIRPIG